MIKKYNYLKILKINKIIIFFKKYLLLDYHLDIKIEVL